MDCFANTTIELSGQVAQVVLEALGVYDEGLQTTHSEAPPCGPYCPGAQSEHAVAVLFSEILPGGQLTQF